MWIHLTPLHLPHFTHTCPHISVPPHCPAQWPPHLTRSRRSHCRCSQKLDTLCLNELPLAALGWCQGWLLQLSYFLASETEIKKKFKEIEFMWWLQFIQQVKTATSTHLYVLGSEEKLPVEVRLFDEVWISDAHLKSDAVNFISKK